MTSTNTATTTTTTATGPTGSVSVEREVRIAASPETIVSFLTDADKLVQWMGHSATLDPRPGGTIRLDYNGFDVMRGEYIEISARRVVFTWGWETDGSPVPAGTSRIEVTLTPDGDSTVLHLVHSGLPGAEAADSHAEGWDHFLPRLVALAGGGDPGIDEWTPRRTELLAGKVHQHLKELRAIVDSCPADQWTGAKTAEGWTVAATASHLMGHAGAVGLACAVAAGNPPEINLTREILDAGNAQQAAENAAISKTAILQQMNETGAAMVQALRDMPDEQLANTFSLPALSSDPVNVEAIINFVVLAGLTEHIASIRAALRETAGAKAAG